MLMYKYLFAASVGFIWCLQVGLCVETKHEQSQTKGLEHDVVKIILDKIKADKANVSSIINRIVDEGLAKVTNFHQICKQHFQTKLEETRQNYLYRLNECAIYDNLEDQIDIVKSDFDLTIKTIVGNGLSGIVKLGQCIGSGNAISCLTTQWVPMTLEAVLGDLRVSADTVLQTLKLAMYGSQAIWSCIQGSYLQNDVSQLVLNAQTCHATAAVVTQSLGSKRT